MSTFDHTFIKGTGTMNWIYFAAGLGIGIAAALIWKSRQEKSVGGITDKVVDEIKAAFGGLSLEALEKFITMADSKLKSERELGTQELDKKKGLIDQQLSTMTNVLEKVAKLMEGLEKDREQKFGELTNQLKNAGEQTAKLTEVTGKLRESLASEKTRGQWGERMAEDVLRMAGFVEDMNYTKQNAINDGQSRPDFTFFLPRDLTVNMDVKFPYSNYVRYIETGTESETDKNAYRDKFLKDVKNRVKEVATSDYINPEQNTVNYVLMFIPNEQIFTFIYEQDSSIFDNALKERVVICSPITLFAVLAIIRQAVDNFAFEQRSNEILLLLGTFKKQWGKFIVKMDVLGKRIQDAQKDFDDLTSTRKRALDRPLDKLDSIRDQRELPLAPEDSIDDSTT